MKLNQFNLSSLSQTMSTPQYDRNRLQSGIVHLGVGGFHRSHQAVYIDELLSLEKNSEWAITGVGIMPQDAKLSHALKEQNGLYTLIEQSDLHTHARIIGAIKEHILGHEYPEQVFHVLALPTTKIVTLTATEGGYFINQASGNLDLTMLAITHDLHQPAQPKTIFGYLAEGLDRRRKNGLPPFSVLSCDNLQSNGHTIKKCLLTFCYERNTALAQWIETYASFPNCMVDRITPITTDDDRAHIVNHYQIEDKVPVVAEPFRQWIIEDNFCHGRPLLEKVGAHFTADVVPYEQMKIRLLNASHSAMGYLGYLCGYEYIHEIAQTSVFVTFLNHLMDAEVMPLLDKVPGIDLTLYKRLLMERFANSKIKDQVLRICMQGSGKLPVFILPSIQDQLKRNGPINRLTLCVASWLRFLNGIDEQGKPIPIVDSEAASLSRIAATSPQDPLPFLQLTHIFGDLQHSARFVAELKFQLQLLYSQGALSTLKQIM